MISLTINLKMALNALIIYFSRSGVNSFIHRQPSIGNTFMLANQIKDMTKADMFQIRPQTNYSTSYEATIWQATKEIFGQKPKLADDLEYPDISKYDVIFFGHPIWMHQIPPICKEFIQHYDKSAWNGKTIGHFCTHGGGGLGSSHKEMESLFPNSKVTETLSIHGLKIEESNGLVADWLKNIGN